MFGVHKNSWRFGWTYNTNEDKINIWSYIYNSNKLTKKRIYIIDFDKEYDFRMNIVKNDSSYSLNLYINNELIVQYCITDLILKHYLLELGFYFGGSTRAPHNMCLEFDRM